MPGPRVALPGAEDGAQEGAGEAYRRASSRTRLSVGAVVAVLILTLGATVAVAVVRSATTPPEHIGAVPSAGATVDEGTLYVHVSGAVREPGLYRLTARARVVDALAAAAGFTEDADRDAVNLARPLSDGEQLVVPVAGADAAATGAAATGPSADGRVNLNTATIADLDTLPRIGPAIAQRIIEWRDANGRFTSIEDLLAVPGIGDKMLEGLRPLVRV